MKSKFYVTTFCNFAHRLSDGKPINHECYIIPPKLLRMEMDDTEKGGFSKETIRLWWEWARSDSRRLHKGISRKE